MSGKSEKYVELDLLENIKKYNEAVKESKLALQFLFTEIEGETVTFTCRFDKLSKNGKNACVNYIVNAKGERCSDADKNGDDAHLWFRDVTSKKNAQADQWKKMIKGQEIKIEGKIGWYTDKNDMRKKYVINPKIIQM